MCEQCPVKDFSGKNCKWPNSCFVETQANQEILSKSSSQSDAEKTYNATNFAQSPENAGCCRGIDKLVVVYERLHRVAVEKPINDQDTLILPQRK